jgi:hypothetical protein
MIQLHTPTNMDKETAKYIIDHYSHLLTLHYAAALKHHRSFIKVDNSDNQMTKEQNEAKTTIYLKNGWLSTNQDVLKLLEDGYDDFEIQAATKLLNEFPEKIILNNCPKCGQLTRTPTAKQCRHCGNDWHDK